MEGLKPFMERGFDNFLGELEPLLLSHTRSSLGRRLRSISRLSIEKISSKPIDRANELKTWRDFP